MSQKKEKTATKTNSIVAFHIPKHLEFDYGDNEAFVTVATVFAMIALLLKNRWAGWVSLFFGLGAFFNERALTSSHEKRSNWPMVLFSVLSLVAHYIPKILLAATSVQE